MDGASRPRQDARGAPARRTPTTRATVGTGAQHFRAAAAAAAFGGAPRRVYLLSSVPAAIACAKRPGRCRRVARTSGFRVGGTGEWVASGLGAREEK